MYGRRKYTTAPARVGISEEDSRQATYTITDSATKHGYSKESIKNILMHRYDEIQVGRGKTMLLGLGFEERDPYYGRINYDCYGHRDGTYTIKAYHAHGGQTELYSWKGY